jgi:glutaredoxin
MRCHLERLQRVIGRAEVTMGWLDNMLSAKPRADMAPAPDEPRTLVLYKYDSCPYCYLVATRLQQMPEVKVTLRDTMREPGARAELLQKTGRAQVPCLFIDDVPLFESRDIVAWLERYQQAGHGAE